MAERSTSDEIFSRGVKPLNALTLIASEMEDSEEVMEQEVSRGRCYWWTDVTFTSRTVEQANKYSGSVCNVRTSHLILFKNGLKTIC